MGSCSVVHGSKLLLYWLRTSLSGSTPEPRGFGLLARRSSWLYVVESSSGGEKEMQEGGDFRAWSSKERAKRERDGRDWMKEKKRRANLRDSEKKNRFQS